MNFCSPFLLMLQASCSLSINDLEHDNARLTFEASQLQQLLEAQDQELQELRRERDSAVAHAEVRPSGLLQHTGLLWVARGGQPLYM
jgi:cell division protein FtsL